MKVFDVEQNSPEWLEVRLGIPTASAFDKIITAKTMKLSTQSVNYMYILIAEILLGRPLDEFTGNDWTERGHEYEEEAAGFYELQTDIEVQKVGFVTDDEQKFGCSPDRLVGDDGLLEIKAPKSSTHVKYLVEGSIGKEYYPQLQGQLLITDRKWVDIISYHPEIRPAIIRIERDDEYLRALAGALWQFNKELQQKLQQIREAA